MYLTIALIMFIVIMVVSLYNVKKIAEIEEEEELGILYWAAVYVNGSEDLKESTGASLSFIALMTIVAIISLVWIVTLPIIALVGIGFLIFKKN
jgi:hypothetical protein